MSNIKEFKDHEHTISEESREKMDMADGNTKNEIDYIMTDKPSMVTGVTVLNRVNIGSDHRMVMGSITLNTRAERRKLLNKNTRTRVDTQMIGTKKNTFQIELKNRFTALKEHDDMDSLNKNMK